MGKLKKIGCGCLIIVLIIIVLGAIFSGVIIKKLISGTIREQTGIVQSTPKDGSGGQTYTDTKTGATINLGVNKIPDGFPKDFPIYPGSTIEASQVGQGFWLTLSTTDSIDKVASFYNTSLKASGWKTIEGSTNNDTTQNMAISNDKLEGYVNITTKNAKTTIIIILGDTPTPTP